MKPEENSDWKALWAILWRAFIFMPYMLGLFVVVGSIWLARWVLPICTGLLLYSGDWSFAIIATALWFLTMWSYRQFRLSRFFERPPSLL